LRLFCFPYAGSGASIYRTWGEELPDTVEICPVQLPGRENRYVEPLYSRFEPLIEALCNGLKPLLDLPYALFGYSMGAFIAFELARTLRWRGDCGPKRLFISARRGPRLPDTRQAISELPDAEFIQQLDTYEGTPKDVIKDSEIMACYLSTLRADFKLCETYKYAPGGLLNVR
jgi:medium-chain acyl-[acyl-carrier-protein] hydrolase